MYLWFKLSKITILGLFKTEMATLRGDSNPK